MHSAKNLKIKKMTKKITLLFALMLSTLMASAQTLIDGIYYNLITEAKQAKVTSGDTKYTGNVTIPESFTYNGVTYSVTSIGSSAFTTCSGLTSVTIPNSVTSIGSYAFVGCKSLTSIIIPDGVQYIYNNTFSDCTALTSITIPNSVVSIGDYAFDGCRSLSSIDIPNSVTKIGKETFQKCFGLKSVTIGNGIETIEYAAFRDCSGLTSAHIHDLDSWCKIAFSHLYSNPLYFAHHLYLGDKEIDSLIIPDGITSVKSYAFAGFTSLKSVTIPGSVTSMDYRSFGYCSGLTDVYCYAEDAPTIGEAFYKVQTSFVTLHVPEASIETYKKTSPWSGFGNILAIDDEPTLPGDVNGDGVVNGTDIQAIINLIVEGEYVEKADVNSDAQVNGTDIQEVINIIVNAE